MKKRLVFFSLIFLILAGSVYAANFGIGDTVEIYNTGSSGLKVRYPDACSSSYVVKYDGTRGSVLSGPSYCDGYYRWKIRWSDGFEGWSAEDWLRKVSVTPSTKFSIGDKVKVNANVVNVRSDPPELAVLGSVNSGDIGTVIAGPFYGVPKGSTGFYHFWKIDYDTKTDGWTAENYLEKVMQCQGIDISCGIYPNCVNCNNNDGCSGNYYRNYYCSSNSAGCSYTSDNCNDCSCSCGGYNTPETIANGNCNDGKDNDCDGYVDGTDSGCVTCTPKTCSQLGKSCGNWDDGCSNTINCGSCPTGQYCDNGVCKTQGECNPSIFPELFIYDAQKNQNLYNALSSISQEFTKINTNMNSELLSAIMATLDKEVSGYGFLPVEERGDYGMGPGCTKIGGVCRSQPYDGDVAGDGRGGVDYKGRGYIQITHKYNYREHCGADCIGTSTPELDICGCKNQWLCTVTDENICPQIKALQPMKAGKIFVSYYQKKYYNGKNLITYSNEKNYWTVGYLIQGGTSYADDFKIKADNYFNLFDTQKTKTQNLISCLSEGVSDNPPICLIQLRQKDTTNPISQINVNEWFDIYVGSSSDDKGISEVRFSSDESQDDTPQGSWTSWYNWQSSSSDGTGIWDAVRKVKTWLFATQGIKEVWTEIKDNSEQTTMCNADIYAQLPCSCGSWQNQGCGQGGCAGTKMYQTRTCTPSGCDVQSRCVDDASCTCTNECSSGQTRCSGNYKQTCGNYDADSCLEWGNNLDCGNSYCENWQANYCKTDDVYRKRNCYDKGCSNGDCFSNLRVEEQFVQDCGSDYCDSWRANYCKSGNVYHNRTCHDKGCFSGVCFDNMNIEEQLVQVCSNGCSNGACSSLPGDVDGNCKVDIFDLAKIGLCYGCIQGQGCWTSCSVADLSKNNVVDIFDLATVGLHYGKSC